MLLVAKDLISQARQAGGTSIIKLIQTMLVVSMVIGEQVKKENFLQALHLNFLNKNKNSFTQN